MWPRVGNGTGQAGIWQSWSCPEYSNETKKSLVSDPVFYSWDWKIVICTAIFPILSHLIKKKTQINKYKISNSNISFYPSQTLSTNHYFNLQVWIKFTHYTYKLYVKSYKYGRDKRVVGLAFYCEYAAGCSFLLVMAHRCWLLVLGGGGITTWGCCACRL